MHRRQRSALLLPLAAVLALLAGCGSGSKSSSTPPPSATPAVVSTSTGPMTTATTPSATTTALLPATCTPAGSAIECVLPLNAAHPGISLETLLPLAQSIDSSVTETTPMVIAAFGGIGHGGYSSAAGNPGKHGNGGEAETTTSIAAYLAAYKTPALYYYLGDSGQGTNVGGLKGGVGGLGGAATIVSPYNLTSSATTPVLACISTGGGQYAQPGCTATTVLLVAGGGGGGGEGATCNGGDGGDGGTAIATTSEAIIGAGGKGTNAGCSGGGGGKGGGIGFGGSGGSGGDGANHHEGGAGVDGVGGMGGPVHTGSGPSVSIPWTNVGYCMYEIGTSGTSTYPCTVTQSSPAEWGEGGEGEWRGSAQPVGGGGGGGGGFGGGGGGGGGGDSDPGGGGGGGGSFAAESTATPGTLTEPGTPDSAGAVYVIFTPS